MQIEAHVKLLNKTDGLKGIADVTLDKAFIIKGVFIREGAKGLFLTYPNYKSGDEYITHCHPITAECRQEIIDTVFTAYEQKLSSAQEKEQNHGKAEYSKTSGGKNKAHSAAPAQENSPAPQEQEAGMSLGM